jgi:DNA primase
MKKFESPSDPKDRVIYGFDRLFEKTDVPLYIVEGWFDAHVIDGVALLGNELSSAQIKWLNKSQRKKVYIPDRFGDGQRIAENALSVGWSVSTPDIGNCKDVNEAVHKYGRMFVMKTIADNTADGLDAATRLGVYCTSETENR